MTTYRIPKRTSPKENDRPSFCAPLSMRLGRGQVSARRLDLLEAIAATGSISAAARQVDMSYKAAWDAVDAINNLVDEPLVIVQHGGSAGGGAQLSAAGSAVLATRERLGAALTSVLQQFGGVGDTDLATLGRLLMRTSARNVLRGTVEKLVHGTVNSDVTLRLRGDDRVAATITRDSADSMDLAPGKSAWALIKASWVILAHDGECGRTSARNRLCGTVQRVQRDAVNAEVVLALPGGNTLTAVITGVSQDSLEFTPGDRACALIKASHVIVGVDE